MPTSAFPRPGGISSRRARGSSLDLRDVRRRCERSVRFESGLYALLARRYSDSFAVGHVGHGVNSYAIGYQLVMGPFIVALQLAWGRVYVDYEKTTDAVRRSFDAVGSLLSLKAPPDVADGQLMVVLSDFRQLHTLGWLSSGQLVDVRPRAEEHSASTPFRPRKRGRRRTAGPRRHPARKRTTASSGGRAT